MARRKSRLSGEDILKFQTLLSLALKKIGVVVVLESVERTDIKTLERDINEYIIDKNLISQETGKYKEVTPYSLSKRSLYNYYLCLKNNDDEIPCTKKVLNSLVHYATNGRIKFWSSFNVNSIQDQKPFDLTVFTKQLQEKYLTEPEFNSIRIIGDRNHQIGQLNMSKYYVQLSSLSLDNLRNRESLLNKEKEYSIQKVEPRISDSSTSYISDKVLTGSQSIIIGNPGIGKSTFAKWLCFSWASGSFKVEDVILYIELRSINFDLDNFLFEYVTDSLPGYESSSYDSLTLSNYITQSKFILDGFDELELWQKKKLLEHIKGLKYVLLSRPYGLIDLRIPDPETFINIDGFNSGCIQQYIDHFLSGYGSEEKSPEEILGIIKHNKVLNEYAHVPLMLSYMLLIYTTSESVQKDLSAIESMYDLHEKVFDWILYSAKQKQIFEFESLSQIRDKMSEFSYEMTLNKRFSYEASFDDPYFEVAKTMSALGFGSQKEEGFRWKFSFSTVTLQEFLAVRYFDKTEINNEAFEYLVSDNFFWNFCLLLIGRLSKQSETSSKVEEIISHLFLIYKEKQDNFYIHTYFMLLGECNQKLCHRVINKEAIELIFQVFQSVYFDNYWNNTYKNSILKILYKSPSTAIISFVDELRLIISDIERPDIQEGEIVGRNTGDVFYIYNVIEVLRAFREEEVLLIVLSTIDKLQTSIDKLNNEIDEEEESDDSCNALLEEQLMRNLQLRSSYLRILGDFSKMAISKHKQKLLKTVERIEIESATDLELIVEDLGINPDEFSDEKFDLDSFKMNSHDYMKNSDGQEIAILTLEQFSERNFHSIVHNDSLSEKELQSLKFVVDWLNENYSNFDDGWDFTYLFDTLLLNLSRFNKREFLDLLFHTAVLHNIEDWEITINRDTFRYYIASILENVQALGDDIEFIRKLTAVFSMCRFNFLSDFHSLREQVMEVFLSYSTKAENSNSAELEPTRTLLIQIANIPSQDFDKKFFIDRLVKYKKDQTTSEFLYRTIILETLFNNFTFFETRYWQLLNSIFYENSNFNSLFFLVAKNESLYKFKSNHIPIFTLFCKLFNTGNSKRIFTELGSHQRVISDINEMMSLTITMSHLLFYLQSLVSRNLYEESLSVLESIITSKDFEDIYEEIVDASITEYCLVHTLFSFFRPNTESYLARINFYNKLNDEPGAKMAFFDRLIDFSEKVGGEFTIETLKVFKPILKSRLHAEIIDLIKQRSISHEQFSHKQFRLLLSGDK